MFMTATADGRAATAAPFYLILRLDPLPEDGRWRPDDTTRQLLESAISSALGEPTTIRALCPNALTAKSLLGGSLSELRRIHALQMSSPEALADETLAWRHEPTNWPGFLIIPITAETSPELLGSYGAESQPIGLPLPGYASEAIAKHTGWDIQAINLASFDQLVTAPIDDVANVPAVARVLQALVKREDTVQTTPTGVTLIHCSSDSHIGLLHYTYNQWQRVSRLPSFHAYMAWKRHFTRIARRLSSAYDIEIRAYPPTVISEDGEIAVDALEQHAINKDWVSEFRPSGVTTDRAQGMLLQAIGTNQDPPAMHRLFLVDRGGKHHHIATYHLMMPGTQDRLIRATRQEADRLGLPIEHETCDTP